MMGTDRATRRKKRNSMNKKHDVTIDKTLCLCNGLMGKLPRAGMQGRGRAEVSGRTGRKNNRARLAVTGGMAVQYNELDRSRPTPYNAQRITSKRMFRDDH